MSMTKLSGFRFQQHDNIGNPSAESDKQFLSSCFVDTGALQILGDTSDPRCIAWGRTGTGKTALLQMLAEQQERTRQLDPHDIALSYISNSTVLRFFEATGLSMDPFYRFLWRHLFVVEILRMRFNLDSENTKSNWWDEKLMSLLRKEAHKDAFDYLRSWGTNFIASTEKQVRDVTARVETDLRANSSMSVSDVFSLGVEGASRLSEEKRFEIHQRGQEDRVPRVL